MIPPRKKSEKSFTLIETLIALGIMVTLVLQMAIIQGQAITFSDYGRKMTKAIWYAKSLMSQIEYQSKFIPLKEMKYSQKEATFSEQLCPKEGDEPCPFTHSIEIANWKLDLLDIFFRQQKQKDGEKQEENPMIGMMKDQLKQYLGEELISSAHVEVSWAEGSRRNSVDLALLLTNQLAIDELIQTFQPLDGSGSSDKSEKAPPKKGSDGDNLDPLGNDEEEREG